MDTQNRTHRGLEDLEGEVISGRYRIIRRIGKGGMGVVYLATQANLGREVCIKVLNPALLDDEDAVGRFEREAKGLSRLQHPNIVTIFDYGRDGDLAYIVMEYAKGETLSKYLKKHGALTLDEFLPIAVQTLKGIGEAHKLGLIHRDIKPANLMLCELEGEQNYVKILDFGLAKLAQGQEDLTKDQQLVGSASYMAPEQILSGVSDPRTDVYALGVMFYLMLTGKKPFVGANDNAILYQHVNSTPAPVGTLLKPEQGVPDTLCQVIDQTLSKDPTKRPQTANDLLNAISYALDAPQIRAGYSSMSMARVDLQKSSDDAETHSMSQPQMPQVGAAPAAAPAPPAPQPAVAQALQTAGDISAVIVKNSDGSSTLLPLAVSGEYSASFTRKRSKDRKMLIIALIVAVAILAVIVVIVVRAAAHATKTQPVADQTIQKDNDLAPIYQKIEDSLAGGMWQDAEDLIESTKDLAPQNSSEHVIRIAGYKKQIEVGRQLSEARKAFDGGDYAGAVEHYQAVLDRDPEQADALQGMQEARDMLNKFGIVRLSLENAEGAELFVDGVSKGTVGDAIQIEPGKHELRIARDGYKAWVKSVDVVGGETTNLSVRLERKSDSSGGTKKTSGDKSGGSDSGLIGGSKSGSRSGGKSGGKSGSKGGGLLGF